MQFVCFECRKVFKRTISYTRPEEPEPLCPQCGESMWLAGRAFKAPAHSNVKQWMKVEALIKGGAVFQYNFGPRPRVLREVRPFLERRIGKLETRRVLAEVMLKNRRRSK